MIKRAGLMFENLPDEAYDQPLGIGTGAGVIFGATGGVMEAALRTAVETLTGETLSGDALNFTDVRGTKGIKEASYKVGDLEVKVAVASGLKNARQLLDDIRAGKANYHFVRDHGMPRRLRKRRRTADSAGAPSATTQIFVHCALRCFMMRTKACRCANRMKTRFIQELYETYLEKPGSHKAHKILHTTYVKRGL